ncbi:NIPSNAP family protein [Allokutzneria sp. A3M-2-11 16]|uniref:NIPSNAP family protein n=1 Tax=Allokutzneria sp. A3M-2-11 16 TaxID=2962043 RepID=UPI0020B84D0E|nr:NIPSNAP family protein [Allokutzneria sp. A3M-2-11 16]MCP3802526.1 NIPSNAP family protein [Allokutzneria sp. A3M-2-11 16]
MTDQVVELRQYTLRPGTRDALIELFDREFLETQDATGMRVIGQFRDEADPDRFVWLRSFPDMAKRERALSAFYGGPVWAQHRDAARATMVDTDNALLLRPVGEGFPLSDRPVPGSTAPPESRFLVTIHYGEEPFRDSYADELGYRPIACFRSEYAANTFPALPVREGEHVFVTVERFAGVLRGGEGKEELVLRPTSRSGLR